VVHCRIDGILVEVEEGWTILEAARFLGIDVPTLCHMDGLSEWGGCRLCTVEIGQGESTKLVSACTYPVEENLVVRTASKRVVQARKVLVELLLASCPNSKIIQDLAAQMGVRKTRFSPDWETCIYCGLCVRMCDEQMRAKAIGLVDRGDHLKISTPFDMKSWECRQCGGCIYVCPACQLRCQGPEPPSVVCGGCLNLEPTCLEVYDDYTCYMGLKGVCGTCVREAPEAKKEGE
jgi:coenzyme F420 hydrogenase subunit beta